jgi:hypothetical protein
MCRIGRMMTTRDPENTQRKSIQIPLHSPQILQKGVELKLEICSGNLTISAIGWTKCMSREKLYKARKRTWVEISY